jgi:hypothetical protein
MLIGFFLFSGDQGGLEQKNRVRPYFVLSGSVAPGKKEVLHDTLQNITECLSTQVNWEKREKSGSKGSYFGT